MHYFWHEMFKIVSVSGVPPQTQLGSLRRSPRPPSRDGLLAFGNRNFVPSALAIYTSPQLTVYLPPMDSNLIP